MRDLELGRLARTLRRRRGWRQADLAVRAGVHRSTVSLIERGRLAGLTFEAVRRALEPLEMRLDLRPWWRGPQLDRLIDANHASLAAFWKSRLEGWGWIVRVEVSFSRYGERGRIDLLAWHPVLRILAVIEIKTDMVDAQELLGTLDVKVRLAPFVAAELGWGRPAFVVPVLIFLSDRTVRRRVARLDALFDRFALRGRAAVSWLRRPAGSAAGSAGAPAAGSAAAPSGLLIFTDLTDAAVVRVSHVGGEHRRRSQAGRSVNGSSAPTSSPSFRDLRDW